MRCAIGRALEISNNKQMYTAQGKYVEFFETSTNRCTDIRTKDGCDKQPQCGWNRSCLPTCGLLDKDSCGLYQDVCAWNDKKNYCSANCGSLDKDRCSSYPSTCLWNDKTKKCSSKTACNDINNKQQCVVQNDCTWNNTECVAKCNTFRRDREKCSAQPYDCSWKQNKSDCDYKEVPCGEIDSLDKCGRQNDCFWMKDDCFPKCNSFKDDKKCKAYPDTCAWDDDKKRCDFKEVPCGEIDDVQQCRLQQNNCKWENNSCLPKCDTFKSQERCDEYRDTCLWKGKACAFKPQTCDKINQKGPCEKQAGCLWKNNDCLQNCAPLKTKDKCNEQSEYCQWTEKTKECSFRKLCGQINNRAECGKQDDCMWKSEKCFPKCAVFAKEKCDYYPACDWDRLKKECNLDQGPCKKKNAPECRTSKMCKWVDNECVMSCKGLSKDKCSAYIACEWGPKPGPVPQQECRVRQVPCKEADSPQECKRLDECRWNKDSSCTADCKIVKALDKCNSFPHCEWKQGEGCDSKQGPCTSAGSETDCKKIDVCEWKNKSCLLRCDYFNKSKCDAFSRSCVWNPLNNKCSVKPQRCDRINDLQECGKQTDCKWKNNDCIPRCDMFPKYKCDDYSMCAWDPRKSSCFYKNPRT